MTKEDDKCLSLFQLKWIRLSFFKKNTQLGTRKNNIEVLQIKNFVKNYCDLRPEWSIWNFAIEVLLEHPTEKIDGFYELVTLIEQSNKSGAVSFD